MPNIYSLKFESDSWHKAEESPKQVVWHANPADTISIEFLQPTDFQKDLLDPDVRSQFEQYATSSGGALVDFEVVKIKELEAARQVFKFRFPAPRDMRMVYIGSLAFPFADYCYMLRAQSIESGTTGTREAAVSLALSKGQPAESAREPVVVKSVDELLGHMRKTPLSRIPSDDEQYDVHFPDHPLSKVRHYLKRFAETLVIDPALYSAKPYRVS